MDKQKKNIRDALNEVLELGTDQSRIEYAKATPGQSTEINKAVDYVAKPEAASPSYKALTQAVKEGKTPEEISQEFGLPVSYVKVLTGLQEGFISPEQLAEKVKDKMDFLKKKKKGKGDDEEENGDDEEENDDEGDEDKGDDTINGKPEDKEKETKYTDDDGEDDGNEDGEVMKMEPAKDKVEIDPVEDDDEDEDDDEGDDGGEKKDDDCGCDDKKKKKKFTKESVGEALRKVLSESKSDK